MKSGKNSDKNINQYVQRKEDLTLLGLPSYIHISKFFINVHESTDESWTTSHVQTTYVLTICDLLMNRHNYPFPKNMTYLLSRSSRDF